MGQTARFFPAAYSKCGLGDARSARGAQDLASGWFPLALSVSLSSGLASPSTVLSGQKLTAGHFAQVASTAMGQSVMAFSW